MVARCETSGLAKGLGLRVGDAQRELAHLPALPIFLMHCTQTFHVWLPSLMRRFAALTKEDRKL